MPFTSRPGFQPKFLLKTNALVRCYQKPFVTNDEDNITSSRNLLLGTKSRKAFCPQGDGVWCVTLRKQLKALRKRLQLNPHQNWQDYSMYFHCRKGVRIKLSRKTAWRRFFVLLAFSHRFCGDQETVRPLPGWGVPNQSLSGGYRIV